MVTWGGKGQGGREGREGGEQGEEGGGEWSAAHGHEDGVVGERWKE